jgi:ribosomal protein S18 acetylase RimI-like enzyme
MIRPFRADDLPALIDITCRAFDGVSIDQNIESLYGPLNGVAWQERKASHIEADIAANPAGILVFETDGGRVVGYISCRVNPHTRIGQIPNFAVHPDHQARGIGRALAHAALAYLRNEGMTHVRIETLEQNRPCMAFYPKLGFREIARQIHYIMPLEPPTP